MLNDIVNRPPVWGWLWTNLGDLVYGPLTVYAYFGGDWRDVGLCVSIQAIIKAVRWWVKLPLWGPLGFAGFGATLGLFEPILVGALVPTFYYGVLNDPPVLDMSNLDRPNLSSMHQVKNTPLRSCVMGRPHTLLGLVTALLHPRTRDQSSPGHPDDPWRSPGLQGTHRCVFTAPSCTTDDPTAIATCYS